MWEIQYSGGEGEANLGLTHKCFCIFVTKSSDGLLLAFPTNALFFSSFRIWPQLWATQKTNVFAFSIIGSIFFFLRKMLIFRVWVGLGHWDPPPFAEKFQQFLLALNTTLYGLWSIRGNWTGNEKTTLYSGSLPLADKKYKKNYVVHTVPGPQVHPPAPAVQSKGEVLLGD